MTESFKNLFILKEREGEKHQCVVASHTPPTGDLTCATQACALTGSQTDHSLVLRPALNPLSQTSQGYWVKQSIKIEWKKQYILHDFVYVKLKKWTKVNNKLFFDPHIWSNSIKKKEWFIHSGWWLPLERGKSWSWRGTQGPSNILVLLISLYTFHIKNI